MIISQHCTKKVWKYRCSGIQTFHGLCANTDSRGKETTALAKSSSSGRCLGTHSYLTNREIQIKSYVEKPSKFNQHIIFHYTLSYAYKWLYRLYLVHKVMVFSPISFYAASRTYEPSSNTKPKYFLGNTRELKLCQYYPCIISHLLLF